MTKEEAVDRFFEEVDNIDEFNQQVHICGHWFDYDTRHERHGYDWVIVDISVDQPGYMPFCIGLWKELHPTAIKQ